MALAQSNALRIVHPCHGAILRDCDGQRRGETLLVTVCGTAPPGWRVIVGGREARRAGELFFCPVEISGTQATIRAEATRRGHRLQAQATVFWDRNSCRRYRLSLDDNIIFLKNLARNARHYKSLFDDPYLAFWHDLHQRYGTKVHINIYYRTEGFDLSEMPAKFRGQWRDNAHWLRLSFHALQDQPPRPYLDAPAEKLLRDFDMVCEQIVRFAGEELLSPFTTIHWGEATREACRALRKRGVVGLAGYFQLRNEKPAVAYYLDAETTKYLSSHDYWKDVEEDLWFITHDLVMNAATPEEIPQILSWKAADPRTEHVMEVMIHEQYFWPEHPLHLPDFKERVIAAVSWLSENNYLPVFYEEGFLGARQ